MSRVPIAVGFLAMGLAASAEARWLARKPDISEATLRAHLSAFAHDSMEGRETGTAGAAQATTYIVGMLRRAGVRPGTPEGFLQTVPLVRSQLDTASAQMFLQLSQSDSVERAPSSMYAPGGFLPITGAFGLNAERRAAVPVAKLGAAMAGTGRRAGRSTLVHAEYVFGGRLGESTVSPALTDDRVVVFLPPRLPDGTPDYELWRVRKDLLEYRGAAAIAIASLDLMPRSFVARMLEPQWTLTGSLASLPDMPPIVAMSHKGGARAMQSGRATVRFESRILPVSTSISNVVAIVEGSDPELKSEYVLLSAHIDHRGMRSGWLYGADTIYNGANAGSGAVALLALAEHFAASQNKPRRSLLFVWTIAEEQGFLGAEYFADHPSVPRDRIAANLSVDLIAPSNGAYPGLELHGSADALRFLGGMLDSLTGAGSPARQVADATSLTCTDGSWHFYRRGIPSVRMSMTRSEELIRQSDDDDIGQVDFDRFRRGTAFFGRLAELVANGARPPKEDQSGIAASTPCVR